MLGQLEEQKVTTKVEKFAEYSPHFIPVHNFLPDEKLFEIFRVIYLDLQTL
jgi:hypothetical protein